MGATLSPDAPVDDASSGSPTGSPTESPRASRGNLIALVVAMVSVAGVSLYRVITLGFLSVAPDDAAYIGVGRELWQLREPLGIDGTTFTIRSWVYPLMMGAASHVTSDPFRGPRYLGWALATTALVLAVVFAYRCARGVGAVATALAILVIPAIWTTVASTRVEVALIFAVMVVLLVVDTPTTKRMLLGGFLAGLTLLIKETSAPLVILPLAYLGVVPKAQWWKLATRFWLTFVLTVFWWFLTVLIVNGEIFPLQGLRQATRRDIPRGFTLNSSAWLLIVLCIAAWLIVAIGRRKDPRGRILVLAGLAFLPASYIAWNAGFAIRQFVPIAMLSAIALGVAGADIVAAVLRRTPRAAAEAVMAVTVVIGLVIVYPIALTQDRTQVLDASDNLDAQIAAFLTTQPGAPTALMSFRYKGEVWARVEGDAKIVPLGFANTIDPPPLRPNIWVDATARDYRILIRDKFAPRVKHADFLILSGPHRFGPRALATWLDLHGKDVGLTPAAQLVATEGYAWSSIYKVENPQVDKIPTIVTSDAISRLTNDGGFHPRGSTVIAATQGYLDRFAVEHPPDGDESYEPLRSAPR